MRSFLLLFIFLSGSVLAQGTWTARATFAGTPREKAAGFSIGTKGYIMGGNVAGTELWEWDQSTDTWMQKTSLGVSMFWHVAFSIGTKGYVTTGSSTALWEYDPVLNIWAPKANYGGPSCTGAIAFTIGNKGYVGTGSPGGNDFWEYDQVLDTWTQRLNFGGAGLYWAVGFSIGTKGYVGTGYDASANNRQDFWEWDQGTNAWTQLANFVNMRRAAVGFALVGKGYIGTGYDVAYLQDWVEYDPIGNTWTPVANFGGPPSCCQATFTIGNRGYVGTGYVNGNSDMFWEYTPEPTSVNELSAIRVSVFPNPVTTHATFTFSHSLMKGLLSVYDISGKKISEEFIPEGVNTFTLERKDVPAGVYLCKIMEDGKEIGLEKIVVR